MALNNNASRLYVVKETTSGTLKVPSAGSEAIALQPGFEMTPDVDVQQNEELKAGIGPSKPITGLEHPTASFSHYLRHSGTEGAYPDYDLLMESLFGSKSANGTERVTAAASSTTVIKMAAGGTDMAKGKAFMIKDAVNGYSIRPVDSMSTNDATIGFAVPVAPAAGVALGKCVNYTPVNTGHPTLSLWLYRANGGAVEAEAGCLITSLQMDVDVGSLVNMTFQAAGTLYYFDPIVITAANNKMDFEDDVGNQEVAIPVKIYRTPLELASAIQAAMDNASTNTITCVYNSTGSNAGKFTFTSNGTTFKLEFLTGTNNAQSIDTTLGFTHTDKTGALTYTSATAQVWTDALTPSLDDSDPLVAKDNEFLIGDRSNYVSMCVQTMTVNVGLDTTEVKCLKSVSGVDSIVVQKRTSSVEITAVLDQHDADKFDRFLNNTTTKGLFNFGVKSGGNWVAGRCGCLYFPQGTISGFRLGDADGVVTMVFTFSPFMDTSGNPEVYFNLL